MTELEQRKDTYTEPIVLTQEELARLPVRHLSAAENAEHMLRCLISYHERTHASQLFSKPDNYLGALRYAYSLVKRELEKEQKEET